VGIFDSGAGGLSILRHLASQASGLWALYLADNRYLPYGDKPTSWLERRAATLTEVLLERGAELVLVACNTATTHTIGTLRTRWPHVPFVGVEPAIKPAARLSRNRRVAVMATPATIQSQRLRQLIDEHAAGAEIHLVPCPGLADAIERADDEALSPLLDQTANRLLATGADTIVLGCTHYPLVADRLAARLGPQVHLIDTAPAVVSRVHHLLGTTPHSHTPTHTEPVQLQVLCTGDVAQIDRALLRWLDSAAHCAHLELPEPTIST
jgi:glutamate racemase